MVYRLPYRIPGRGNATEVRCIHAEVAETPRVLEGRCATGTADAA